MSRPYKGRGRRWEPRTRVNERIRVREVRVVGADGVQVGVLETRDAIALAKRHGLDLVEVAPNARPPVCRVCDFGKYKYEESKKKKENKKTAQTNKVKEVQLRPRCEKHDFDFKLTRAIDFLCADMKVKIYLRFRGRENAHKEFGFDAVKRFVKELVPFGKTDTAPRLVGRGITVLVNPLPAKQRAENPHRKHGEEISMEDEIHYDDDEETGDEESAEPTGDALNNAFENLEAPDEKQAKA